MCMGMGGYVLEWVYVYRNGCMNTGMTVYIQIGMGECVYSVYTVCIQC